MDVTLDLDSFKALASESRVTLLKALLKRRMTASELSEETGLRVQTVSEHLSRLETAGLVQRHEEGRKWVYHSLTDKGRAIARPESIPGKIWVLLAISLVTLAVGGWRLISTLTPVRYDYSTGIPPAAQGSMVGSSTPAASAMPIGSTQSAAISGIYSASPEGVLLWLVVVIVGGLLLGFALSKLLRSR